MPGRLGLETSPASRIYAPSGMASKVDGWMVVLSAGMEATVDFFRVVSFLDIAQHLVNKDATVALGMGSEGAGRLQKPTPLKPGRGREVRPVEGVRSGLKNPQSQ